MPNWHSAFPIKIYLYPEKPIHKKMTPLLLVIIDGFGLQQGGEQTDNIINHAAMPCWQELLANYPLAKLQASEEYVGLPKHQMGNSEVGHMNIGSGRVIWQELPRISKACADGSFATNPVFQNLIKLAQKNKSAFHVIGMLSNGGVHGYQDHLEYVANILEKQKITSWLHFISDGRDTAPQSIKNFWQNFQNRTHQNQYVKPASLSGRYFAMDRDKNWQRTEKAFSAIVHGIAPHRADNLSAGIDYAYQQNIYDEFIPPMVLQNYDGMKAGDVVLFMNFRADRARQLSTALLADDFAFFSRSGNGNEFTPPAMMAGLVEYSKTLSKKMGVLFAKQLFANTFGEVIAEKKLRQLRIAETEKYAHVTFFFNGGREEPYQLEERIMIPSPKVATYDLKPEMSAVEITDAVIDSLNKQQHDVIILNYANADMVGHAGLIKPAIKALETLDKCLARLYDTIKQQNGIMVITADHGNIETLFDKKTNQPHTAHTLNPVPFLLVADKTKWQNFTLSPDGKLADIAPTLLTLLTINKPSAMTGESLLIKNNQKIG
ncbi:MAG: 2,3-bisphosphoglycerate-independent phosphoglycerate mutase [Alphaproteobacteria bacterium]